MVKNELEKLNFQYNLLKCLISFLLLSGLMGCSSRIISPEPLSDAEMVKLDNLKKLNYDQLKANQKVSNKASSIRNIALYEMALSIGMRSGLYSRAKEINDYLVDNNSILDDIFDFRELILPDRIIPPVLIEAHKTMDASSSESLPNNKDAFLLNNNPTGQELSKSKVKIARAQNNFTTLRITDRLYKILKQARFAVTVPSWRDYLSMEFVMPAMPESAILPKNNDEKETWAEGVEAGWAMGLSQADQILQQNLMLLKRDYLGMLRYRKLLAMGIVSKPYVSKRNYGVTGNGDEIKINDRVLTISALPALKPNSKVWQAVLSQNSEQELEYKLSRVGFDTLMKYLPENKGKDRVKDKDLINKREIHKK